MVIRNKSLSLTPAVQPNVDAKDPSTRCEALPPHWQNQGQKHLGPCALAQSHVVVRNTPQVSPGSSIGVHLGEQQGLTSWGLDKPHQSLHKSPQQAANLPRQQFRAVDAVQVSRWGPSCPRIAAILISSTIFWSKVCFGCCSKQDLSILRSHQYKLLQLPFVTERLSVPDRLSWETVSANTQG